MLEAVKLVLDKGADVNAADFFGTTALHVAAQQGAIDVIQLLLERGANKKAKDERDRTPFDLTVGGAAGRGRPEAGALLRVD